MPRQTEEPATTEEPAASDNPASANDAAFAFSEAWVKGEYGAMYDLLATETQSELSREEFIDRYLGIVQEAGIFDVAVTLTGEQIHERPGSGAGRTPNHQSRNDLPRTT